MIPVITAIRLSGAAGREELPLLVLGPPEATSAMSCWSQCAAFLAADFDVLAWDLPGQGYNTAVPQDPPSTEDLAEGVLAVVDDVLAERGGSGESGTLFAYVGLGVGGEVGARLHADLPERVWSRWDVPDGWSPNERPKQVAALIGQHVLGRAAPTTTATSRLDEPAERRRIDDLNAQQYDALRDLTDALSELNLAGATTGLSTASIVEHTASVRALTHALSSPGDGDGWPHPVTRITRTRYETPREWAQEGRSVRINDLNPLHPSLEVSIDVSSPIVGRSATAEVTLDALQEGPPDTVHGGTLAFLMDSMLGILVQSAGVPAVTGWLNTRYLARTPLEHPLRLASQIVGHEGRKISVESWVEVDGRRTVETSAMFIEVALARRAGDPG